MSSTSVEIGTLIAVILKAKNLPNKRHIGKQDPYCCVTLNGEKRRTRAIKRGGQHPEWDEEVRFSLLEDLDEIEGSPNGTNTPPPLPPKNNKGPRKIKGGTSMKLQCFADDPREPDLIGETMVDLTEVLTKGETDEWFTIMNKDKYCGEVYLELTFWSNETPPERKVTPKPTKKNKQYAGPGNFVPSAGGSGSQSSRISSMGSPIDDRQSSLPASLRASNPAAKLELYSPPYEQRSRFPLADGITKDFGELSVSDQRQRESYPSPQGQTPRPASSMGFATLSASHGFDPSTYSDGGSQFFDRPVTPTQSHHRATISGGPPPFAGQPPYRPRYETGALPASYAPQQSATRHNGPRYSLPTPSSGFAPIPNPALPPILPLASHQPESLTFSPPPPTQTPGSITYGASQMPVQPGFAPIPVQTPVPSGYMSPVQHSSSFHPSQSYISQSQMPFQYPQYAPQPPPSVPPQQYAPSPSQSAPPQHYPPPQQYPPPQPPASVPPQSHSAPPQPFPSYVPSTPSPPHDYVPPPPPLSSLPSSQSAGSRPLPQQPQAYGQQLVQHQSSPTLPPGSQSYSPTQSGAVAFPSANGYSSVPPPPAPPQVGHERTTSQSYHQPPNPVPPPPPPSLSQYQSSSPSGRPVLPQPPVNYHQQQQPIYQPIPPPPPPPPDFMQHLQSPPPPPPPPLQSNLVQPYYPGPPPQSLWIPPQGSFNGNYFHDQGQSGRV